MMNREKFQKAAKYLTPLFLIFLILYPLKQICLGVDLWDSGYNYANFRYAGTEYMDSMWFFATRIANMAGSLLMHLPFADTMLAMNLYTGLFISLLATAGFLFCTRVLKLPLWMGFIGEMAACGLCWLPTASLYNYLTYVFLLFGCILLYLGLVRKKNGYLAAAGILLGLNVGVRFSNLVQMGLILAVWCYGRMTKSSLREVIKQTLICVAGYVAALGSFLIWIDLQYGLSEYVNSIARLFAMTEVANDYSPLRMLTGVFREYINAGYWIKRFGAALAVGTAVCVILPGKAIWLKKLLCVGITAVLYGWLLTHKFFYPDFATYQSVYDPCVMLLLMAVGTSCIFFTKRDIAKEDKLLAVMEILVIFLTSLGGNNAIYYCINNMFLVMPLLIYMIWKLWKEQKSMLLFSWKVTVSALTILVCILSFKFDGTFVYEEATGGRNFSTEITEIPVLRGMKTERTKAESLTELYRYLKESELADRRCILYGQIPGVAYYLELPPAMNVWCDLESYTYDVMCADLRKVEEKAESGGEAPVVILDRRWAEYLENRGEPDSLWGENMLRKGRLLKDFMDRYGYQAAFTNEKYAVYEKKQ